MSKKPMYVRLEPVASHMETAYVYARRSSAIRRKVGALVVKNDSPISIGYNGTARGDSNVCEFVNEDGFLVTKPEVLHAEANAIHKVSRSHESCEGADLYVTTVPCFECAKQIYQAGIRRVFFSEDYRCTKGKDYLQQRGIEVIQVGMADSLLSQEVQAWNSQAQVHVSDLDAATVDWLEGDSCQKIAG